MNLSQLIEKSIQDQKIKKLEGLFVVNHQDTLTHALNVIFSSLEPIIGAPYFDEELGNDTLEINQEDFTTFIIDEKQLIDLKVLVLSNLSLGTIPAEIFQLRNLEVLVIAHDQLSFIPSEIGQLSNLTYLNLKSNELKNLPKEIAHLNNLTHLYLRNNQFSILPLEITKLPKLVNLELSYNHISTFPSEIIQISGLETLHLIGNQLKTIPPEIGQLSNLQQLYLINNHLQSVPPEIAKLNKLEGLYLGRNQLVTIPSEIGQLANLKGLSLSHNQLSSLPSEIGQLSQLEFLTFGNNKFTSCPSFVIHMESLDILGLHNNLIDIPEEILQVITREEGQYGYPRNNAPKIIQYLREQQKSSQSLNETKLLVVGQGGVGKTSLIKRLIENQYNPNSGKTEGINIHNHPVEVPERGEVQLNIWDFGGQEIMHATHQFFLTKRSIYLYILDARTEEKANRPDYWLSLIENYAPNAPIILIINKIDDNPILSLNESQLQRKYNIVKILRTSCATGEGIAALQQTLTDTISTLPHVSDKLPATWFQVKQALEESKQNQDIIPFTQFDQLCEEHTVSPQVRSLLLQLLHDLGTVLNFYDDSGEVLALEDTKILNPAWVTEGVYAIINAQGVFESEGVLSKTNLRHILDKKRYPTNEARSFILGMMEQFELSFPFDSGRKHLIPDLLPETEPDFDWDEAGSLRFDYRYRGYMPPSTFTRFVVRQHARIVNQATMLWRSGVVIGYDGMEALVRADFPAQRISVFVSGDNHNRRFLLEIVRAEFEYIHSTYANIQVREYVPIPNESDAAVSYRALRAAEREGRPDVYVEDLDDYIPVRALLESVDGPRSRRDLRELLTTRFSIGELEDAIHDVGLDAQNIAGKNPKKADLIRELLTYLERRGRMDTFLTHITQNRPDLRYR